MDQVAKMIAARTATGARRQIFFVQLGSFDTHGDQLNRQQQLFAQLSPALKALYDATVALGGPDDAECEGRWIPTVSVDRYGATLARWLGVPQPALGDVFPNLGAFAVGDLGFMT